MNGEHDAVRAVRAWLEADWSRHFLRQGGKRWRSDTLVRDLKRRGVCDSELAAWQALAVLRHQGVLDAPAALDHRLSVRMGLSEGERHRLIQSLPRPDAALGLEGDLAVAWSRALEAGLADWSLDDQCRLVEGLRRLAADLPAAYDLGAYRASARYLLGSAKLLQALPAELVRAFGIEPRDFRPMPTWLLAEAPEVPQGLLLIENPQSFEQARRLGVGDRLALVCGFGYGLALGEALADVDRVRLVGERPPRQGLARLLSLPSQTYWGDLDPEGLRLYRALKRRLPRLCLSALMAPMAEGLEAEGGPPSASPDRQGGAAGQRRRGERARSGMAGGCPRARAGRRASGPGSRGTLAGRSRGRVRRPQPLASTRLRPRCLAW
ncbi:Wadjet anti-phage system protein JetD domain-containing protein [Halomonas beimenensis]|uniref:Wadjet anti-phage system protein JetD domain-containing protein n=1 Tax=Halomonas beimenensis TaxID=475662 RepID=UPI0031DFA8A1